MYGKIYVFHILLVKADDLEWRFSYSLEMTDP
jgi:hypothetical protein